MSDVLNIDLDKLPETSITIEVLDINGRLVYRADYDLEVPTIQLDLNSMNLPSGLYLMNVRTGDEVMSKRFVKE
ncbi:MAG: T9SS type A sorting domain-containing protein [Lewinellaceae bacterium]|nr:T9SS type A sorting domain-containing protein [Lewinellaceae bacterium]